MANHEDTLFETIKIIAKKEFDKAYSPKLTMGRIVGTSGDKYIVEMLEITYTIPSVNGAKHNLNESVWICQPYGNTNQQFILGGEIKSETVIGTVASVSGKTGDVILNKSDIGLNNVDNTSDLNKPISTETQTALNNKVDKTSVLTPVPEGAKFTDTVTTVNGKTGIITKDDIVALGIPSQDTVYTHPTSHPATMIEEDDAHRFVTADEKLLISNGTHSHNNLSLLQTITQVIVDGWNSAASHITDKIKHITSSERNLWNTVSDKVDKVTGKQLSTEDYTTAEKSKLSNIENGANQYTHPSTHPVTMITGLPDSLPANGGNSATVNGHTVNSDVPLNAKFTDTNTTYSEITTAEIDVGTASTGRTITGRRVKYILDKVSSMISVAIGALTKSSVGLGNVDNTSDASKPISTATQTALDGKVNNSQVLTDVPANAKFTDTITIINNKTGVVTKADITALGIPAQDTVYTHPSTHPASMITGLSTVATSGNYSDLINKPAIPTKTSQLTNDSGYINASSSISGNSATSTKLQTPRTINGVSFDGTRNITISATPISHTHPKSQISDMPTKLSQFIDDIGASGGEQGALIFDTLAAQQGAKLKEYKVGENYVSEIRLSSNNLLLASKTESRSGENYITTIKVYNDDGVTIKQTITIAESKDSSGNYITTIS